MLSHPFDSLTVCSGNRLIFTPCPGLKGVELVTSLQQLKAAEVDVLVTMMPDKDLVAEGVSELGALSLQQGLAWFQLPVEDDCAPEQPFTLAWERHQAAILARLAQGQTIAVHCKGGTGRTGLMHAILLLELGYSLAEAIALVQGVRPKSLRLTSHLDYLAAYQPT